MPSTLADDLSPDAPPPVRRIASAPARPQRAALVDKAALACSMAQLEHRVQLLAAESFQPDLIAVAKRHHVGAMSDDPWYDAMLHGSGRRCIKRSAHEKHKGGQSRGGNEHAGGRGGTTTVRARRAAPAVLYHTTVGGRTTHYAVAERPVGKRYERREWHKARLMPRPFLMREELRWREDEEACERTLRDLGIASLLSHRKRDVV